MIEKKVDERDRLKVCLDLMLRLYQMETENPDKISQFLMIKEEAHQVISKMASAPEVVFVFPFRFSKN